jgi:hypothetical protein
LGRGPAGGAGGAGDGAGDEPEAVTPLDALAAWETIAWPPVTVMFMVAEVPKPPLAWSHARTYMLWLPLLTGTETDSEVELEFP